MNSFYISDTELYHHDIKTKRAETCPFVFLLYILIREIYNVYNEILLKEVEEMIVIGIVLVTLGISLIFSAVNPKK